ncbi:MAG TPA: acetyl-CoA carboxylase biotin carboxyl carrier protein [Planctomycetota bacterium]|nr:acetyl-CoA carboxylase biotin carboxyl carrier protein [Planctomycetota bacterium]
MDLETIEKLLGLMKQFDLSELRVNEKELEFSARRGERPQVPQSIMMAPPALAPAPAAAAAPAAAEAHAGPKLKEITSPIVGTFYRSPAPDQPPFKEVGDSVNPDDVVCIVEAMKVMNEVKAGIGGKIRKILLDNASPVEFGQPLFLVEAG